MNKTNTKGFTLIELLVVIAIIGILSTIAMTSLNGARKKAKDSAFQSSASSVKGAAITCCDSEGMKLTKSDPIAPGNAICYDTSDNAQTDLGSYPDSSSIAAIAVDRDCDDDNGWSITMTAPTGGTITAMTCTEEGCS